MSGLVVMACSLISIHSPHARGDPLIGAETLKIGQFQSTPLMRGETSATITASQDMLFQSTPLMRGETAELVKITACRLISIHSPHARGDSTVIYFNIIRWISIHSPHARGDFQLDLLYSRQTDFNPLPSCEGRRFNIGKLSLDGIFQSTPLMRGETTLKITIFKCQFISIHSPHARGDVHNMVHSRHYFYFNPLPSCEGRHFHNHPVNPEQFISIHSPHARGDRWRLYG